MFFTNKRVEIFNLPKILTSKMFQPIRYKYLNHKSLTLIPDQSILRCHCENSLFIDPEHGCEWYVIIN